MKLADPYNSHISLLIPNYPSTKQALTYWTLPPLRLLQSAILLRRIALPSQIHHLNTNLCHLHPLHRLRLLQPPTRAETKTLGIINGMLNYTHYRPPYIL